MKTQIITLHGWWRTS
ncbi:MULTISPECIES: trp operon leader peptide [Raoultella]|nr:trp operon leader peptide [Raoultella sp. 10-1]